MTIEYLVNTIKMIVENRTWFKDRGGSFKVSQNYEIDEIGQDQYPLFFIELPFNITVTNTREEVSFAMTMLEMTDPDYTMQDIYAIDFCKTKLQYIIDKMKEDMEFYIQDTYTFLSLTRFGNDISAGCRVELTVIFTKTMGACDPDEIEE